MTGITRGLYLSVLSITGGTSLHITGLKMSSGCCVGAFQNLEFVTLFVGVFEARL